MAIDYGLFVEFEILMKNMYGEDKNHPTENPPAFKDETKRKSINGWDYLNTGGCNV